MPGTIFGWAPSSPIAEELQKIGGPTLDLPPSVEVSRIDKLHDLWTEAGMENIHTRSISVQRQFAAFDDFWNATRMATSIHRAIEQLASMKSRQ